MKRTEAERSTPTDEMLVAAIQADPSSEIARKAASELLGRYSRAVYLWCRRYVRDHELAMELSQDVLLSAWKELPNLDSGRAFASWLMKIARNRALSEVRRPRLFEPEGPEFERTPSETPDPLRRLEDADSERRLRLILERHLDPVERQALWMRCVDGLAVDEITSLLSLTGRSGARGVLQRARRKLNRARAEGRLEEGL